MTFEIEPQSRYALKARDSAKALGLEFRVFSYSKILESVQDGEDFIEKCAEVTGTEFDEQLKFALVSDITFAEGTYGNASIGVVRYGDRFDFKKLAQVLIDAGIYPSDIKKGKISPRKTDPRLLGIEPGYLGINENARYPVTTIDVSMADRQELAPIPYVFDVSIKNLPRVCFPTGEGKADELVVVSADTPLGDRLDKFLEGYIGTKAFLFGDVRK